MLWIHCVNQVGMAVTNVTSHETPNVSIEINGRFPGRLGIGGWSSIYFVRCLRRRCREKNRRWVNAGIDYTFKNPFVGGIKKCKCMAILRVFPQKIVHLGGGFKHFLLFRCVVSASRTIGNIFYFHPYLGKWSNLTNIFQMGWNHQLVHCLGWQYNEPMEWWCWGKSCCIFSPLKMEVWIWHKNLIVWKFSICVKNGMSPIWASFHCLGNFPLNHGRRGRYLWQNWDLTRVRDHEKKQPWKPSTNHDQQVVEKRWGNIVRRIQPPKKGHLFARLV